MNNVRHETVYFSGRVQGVGFRQGTLEVAREFEVAGEVRNLDDGRVGLEAEGRREEIDAFLRAIDERLHGYIRKIERSGCERSAQFSGFRIR
ncbi:MAG: acylphosphatase [Opitutaceae bacterium]|nr:acylphosphatase [Opitutaceae bacterium]